MSLHRLSLLRRSHLRYGQKTTRSSSIAHLSPLANLRTRRFARRSRIVSSSFSSLALIPSPVENGVGVNLRHGKSGWPATKSEEIVHVYTNNRGTSSETASIQLGRRGFNVTKTQLNPRGAQQIFEQMTSDVDALTAALCAHLDGWNMQSWTTAHIVKISNRRGHRKWPTVSSLWNGTVRQQCDQQ